MTRKATPEADHYFHVEVTVAACIESDGKALGRNMVDVTFGFAQRAATPPPDVSDAAVNAALAHGISPVLAAIQTVITSLGMVALGTIDEPMNEHSKPTGELGLSSPVRVVVSMPDAPAPSSGRPS